MKNNRKILMAMCSIALVLMTGCGNSTDEINAKSNNQSPNNTESTKNEIQLDSGNNPSEIKKEVYLKKLNAMEESDKNIESAITMLDMTKQASKRYKKWDAELNEIYEVLKAQLSSEQMDALKEEQRNWIKYRDKTAKKASLKYEGGSMESLEYVATLANLTRDRCFELVESYMK